MEAPFFGGGMAMAGIKQGYSPLFTEKSCQFAEGQNPPKIDGNRSSDWLEGLVRLANPGDADRIGSLPVTQTGGWRLKQGCVSIGA